VGVPAVDAPVTPAEADIEALLQLCDAALDGEELDRDALETCCGGPDDVVLWLEDRTGAAVVAPGLDPRSLHLQLLAVEPAAVGAGRGRALLSAAAGHAARCGAHRLELGGAAAGTRYLWPGVDVRHLRMLALTDSMGARWSGAAVNLSCASTFRAPAPDGVELRRVIDDGDARDVLRFAENAFPHWQDELRRGIDHGTAVAAFAATGIVVGFACHSVNRRGWFGPTGVDPSARGAGVGAALLAAACRDLMAAGHRDVEISWIGPVAFYAKTAGAGVSRVFRTGWLEPR
jgi:mycothiol synthase